MTATTETVTYGWRQVSDLCPGLTHRKLNYWCICGLFGPEQQGLGSGSRRRFTAEDVVVLRAIDRVSVALVSTGGRCGGDTELYRDVAAQVRAGVREVRIRLTDHVTLTVDVADLHVADLHTADSGGAGR
jgi:hypothetical protein